MPYADPEKAREYKRRYYEANPEKWRESRERSREKRRIAERERYRANPARAAERHRAWREANPEKVRENMRRWLANGGDPHWRRHEAVARLWHEQGGKCYLCEKPIQLEESVLEHDHRCCPRLKFCAACTRGVSCSRCNHVIGHAEDDPDRLETIARNLRAKLAEMDERLAASIRQKESALLFSWPSAGLSSVRNEPYLDAS